MFNLQPTAGADYRVSTVARPRGACQGITSLQLFLLPSTDYVNGTGPRLRDMIEDYCGYGTPPPVPPRRLIGAYALTLTQALTLMPFLLLSIPCERLPPLTIGQWTLFLRMTNNLLFSLQVALTDCLWP